MMKNKNLFSIQKGLDRLADVQDKSLALKVVKNKNFLNEKLKNLQKLLYNPQYEVFERERININEKYSQKDTNDKPVIQNESYIIHYKEQFNKEINMLKKQYKEAIQEYEKQVEEYNSELEKEADVNFIPFSVDELPKSTSASTMLLINDILRFE